MGEHRTQMIAASSKRWAWQIKALDGRERAISIRKFYLNSAGDLEGQGRDVTIDLENAPEVIRGLLAAYQYLKSLP